MNDGEPALHVERAGPGRAAGFFAPTFEVTGREHGVVVADENNRLTRRFRAPDQMLAETVTRHDLAAQRGNRRERFAQQRTDAIHAVDVRGVAIHLDPRPGQCDRAVGIYVPSSEGVFSGLFRVQRNFWP